MLIAAGVVHMPQKRTIRSILNLKEGKSAFGKTPGNFPMITYGIKNKINNITNDPIELEDNLLLPNFWRHENPYTAHKGRIEKRMLMSVSQTKNSGVPVRYLICCVCFQPTNSKLFPARKPIRRTVRGKNIFVNALCIGNLLSKMIFHPIFYPKQK
jgi:hypothetical protein